MRRWLILSGLMVGLLLGLAACSVFSPQSTTALETQIAAKIYATLTASAPTPLPPPTTAPAPSATPGPTISPTALTQAIVRANLLNLREGPGTNYLVLQTLKANDKLGVVAQYNNCAWYKVKAPDGSLGWVLGDPTYIETTIDCRLLAHGAFRPPNGTVVLDARTRGGNGQLQIENGGALDALVILVGSDGKPLVAFYVREKENFTLFNIPDGNYQLFFAKGNSWDGMDRVFMDQIAIRKINLPLEFTTTNTSTPVWKIPLQEDGRSTPAEAASFPSLKPAQ